MQSGKSTVLTGHSVRVTALAFSPCGQMLASGDEQGELRIWRWIGGEWQTHVFAWNCEHQADVHGSRITAVDFSPDGSLLVSASANGRLRIWESATGALQHTPEDARIDILGSLICDANFTADGSEIIAIISQRHDNAMRLFRLDGQTGAMKSIGLEAGLAIQGEFVLQSTSETSARIWRLLQRDKTLRELRDAPARGAYFWTENGPIICVNDTRNIRMWTRDSDDPTVRQVTANPAEPPHLHFGRHCFSVTPATVLATYQRNGEIVLWDIVSNVRMKVADAPPTVQHRMIPHALHHGTGMLAYAEHRSSSIHVMSCLLPPLASDLSSWERLDKPDDGEDAQWVLRM